MRKRLDQRELGEVELTKQLVAFHDRRPRRLLAGGIAGQEHPQILDARARHAVVEIDEQRAVLAPQDVAGVAVAVNAQARQRPEIVEALSDSSDDLFADPRVLFVERLGYKAASQHGGARLHAQPLDRQRRPMLETARERRCACMRASVRPSKVSVALSSSSGARPARYGKRGEPQPAMLEQTVAVAFDGRGHRQLRRGELDA